MSITFSGLATGLDTDSIVDDLMAVERAPLDRIEAAKASDLERLEAYAQFDSKLDDLKAAVSEMTLTSQIRSTAVSQSSEDAFTATSNGAVEGSYEISVAQLSQVQKNITDGFSSRTDSIFGTGTIDINGTTINVTEENNSVAGLVEAINAVSDTTGVQVSVINSGTNDPYHMVLTGQDANTSFTITSELIDSDYDFNTTQETQSAQQAVAFIDGIRVVSDSNTISGAISGVTINLNSVSSTLSEGTEEVGVAPWDWADPPVYNTDQMSVEADTEALKEKITAFVTAYNDAIDWINDGYLEFGGSSEVTEDEDGETILSSVLRGDATISSVKRQLQRLFTETIDNSGEFQILSEIGITTNLDGTLSQDNTELDEALENNFTSMVSLLSGDDTTDGVMKKFNSLLLDLTSSTDGMYATQKSSYETAENRYDYQILLMEARLEKREESLRSQFSAMETLISSLNAQGDYFEQQMAALTGDS